MIPRAHRAIAPFAALALGCPLPPQANVDQPTASASSSNVDAPPTRRGPVVVALVIDQLPMWMAIERWKLLPNEGGFTKLLTEANAIAELHHGHAHNSTAPGHAALFSGATSHDSGITTNSDLGEKGEHLSSLADPTTEVVTGTGIERRNSSSIASLKVPTVADRLRAEKSDATIIALSMKDRGSIFGGGRKPDALLFFDATADAFITSTAYATSTPAWAKAFTTPGAAAAYRKEVWLPLEPKWLATHTDLPSPDLGQGDYFGLGQKFPHDLEHAKKPSKAFSATPYADVMLVDAAMAAVDLIAAGTKPALLSVSLSSNDYIGHMFGPDAPEAWDQMIRLHAQLNRLLKYLDEKLGPSGYAVVLSADHGVPPTPEVLNQGFCGRPDPDRFERRCERSIRLFESEVAKIAEDAADKVAGKGDWVLGGSEPFIVFRPETRALPKAKLDAVVAAVQKALMKVPGIARTVDVRTSPETCPPLSDESIDALVCRSISGTRGGDIYILAQPGCFFDTGYVEGDGVNHGTPYLFDRAVPLIVRRFRDDTPPLGDITKIPLDGRPIVDQRAYAATIAGLFGITPPDLAKGGQDLSSTVTR